jgi:hypothetical protein
VIWRRHLPLSIMPGSRRDIRSDDGAMVDVSSETLKLALPGGSRLNLRIARQPSKEICACISEPPNSILTFVEQNAGRPNCGGSR